jgi:prophage regulatory protein
MSDYVSIERKNQTAKRVGLSVRQLERLEAEGRFPRRVKLSGNSSGWVESEVTEWIKARIAARAKPIVADRPAHAA